MKIYRKLKLWLSHFFEITVADFSSEVTDRMQVKASVGRFIIDAPNVNYAYGGLDVFFRLAFHKLGLPEPGMNKVLILGFGVGNVAKLLEKHENPPDEITGVEKDRQLKAAAKQYFNIDKLQRTTVYYQDAYQFVKECNATFDLIIVDLFVDGSVPAEAEKEDFLLNLKHKLNPAGVLLFNRMAHDAGHAKKSKAFFDYFTKLLGHARQFSIHENLFIFFRKTD